MEDYQAENQRFNFDNMLDYTQFEIDLLQTLSTKYKHQFEQLIARCIIKNNIHCSVISGGQRYIGYINAINTGLQNEQFKEIWGQLEWKKKQVFHWNVFSSIYPEKILFYSSFVNVISAEHNTAPLVVQKIFL